MLVSVPALLAGLSLTACGADSTAGPAKAAAPAPVSSAPVPAAPIAAQPAAPAAASSASPTGSTGSTGARQANCLTRNLKWTVTLLADAAPDTKDPANAELVAVNSGAQSCVLAGYPTLEFHVGKGPQAVGAGKGNPAPLTLAPGKQAVLALHYSEFNGKGPDSANCVSVTADSADVTAPGDNTAGRAPVVDQHGKPAQITICGDHVLMGAPVAR
ncbi:DUF4232 domain-containing protein [Kitasatospora viridis]|nr:DUF4232 domain-containing protein [Kitasatospora viridis]